MNELEEDLRQLRESCNQLVKFAEDVEGLLIDLVGLEIAEVDAVLDKYEVTVEGKYPRMKEV